MNTPQTSPNCTRLSAEQVAGYLTSSGQATIIFITRDLHIGYLNEEIKLLWNKNAVEIGATLYSIAPELANLAEILVHVWDSGEPFHDINSFSNVNYNGNLVAVPFDYNHRPIKDAEGKTIAIISSAVKVEERLLIDNELKNLALEERNLNMHLTNLNHELENSRMQLANALQAANLGSYDLDLTTGFMSCSNQCKLNFGRSVNADFTYDELLECISPSYHRDFIECIAAAVDSKKSFSLEYQIQWQDGSVHWIQSNGTPQYNESGLAIKIVGVTQLITEKKVYQAKKDEFLSVASHELKTPLTVLKASLQMLNRLKPTIDNQLVVKLIESCNVGVAKIGAMLNEYLDAGRYADGHIALNITSFDINDLLADSVLHLNEMERSKLKIVNCPHSIMGDKNRLEQVLINFVNNAFKYAPESKEIILSAEISDRLVRFSVRDFGDGISESHINHVFERYWQRDVKQDNSKGLGLGLYISSQIIKKHQGTIGVDSSLGQGATFWFCIPRK